MNRMFICSKNNYIIKKDDAFIMTQFYSDCFFDYLKFVFEGKIFYLNKFKSDKKEKILSIFNSLNIKKNLDSINSNSKNKRAAHNLNDIL